MGRIGLPELIILLVVGLLMLSFFKKSIFLRALMKVILKTERPGTDQRQRFAAIGFIVGAVIGFLTRPSAFLVGQLPFSAVISRGGTLSGMDQLLVPTAQASFNQMLFLGLVGAAIGFGVPMLRSRPQPQSERAVSLPSPGKTEVLTNEVILQLIGAGLGDEPILEKMKYSRCVFALSASELSSLKRSGASDRLIAAMLQTQAQGQPPV